MPNTGTSSFVSQKLFNKVSKGRRLFSHHPTYSFVFLPTSDAVPRLSHTRLTVVLGGEFAESTPQSLEFQVKYDYDTNTNVPALRVKVLEIYSLKSCKSLIGSGNRKVISVNNARFTDYHNILYYIYTGTLNLRFNTQLPYKEGLYNDPTG